VKDERGMKANIKKGRRRGRNDLREGSTVVLRSGGKTDKVQTRK